MDFLTNAIGKITSAAALNALVLPGLTFVSMSFLSGFFPNIIPSYGLQLIPILWFCLIFLVVDAFLMEPIRKFVLKF